MGSPGIFCREVQDIRQSRLARFSKICKIVCIVLYVTIFTVFFFLIDMLCITVLYGVRLHNANHTTMF